jgi:DNA repair protein RecO (recombination protein O)
MEATEKALVLRVGRFREADAWVRLLTPSHGVFTAFAFGGLRSRRRFLGCLDPLNLVLFSITSDKRGAYQRLTEGTLLNGFQALKRNKALVGQAVNCIKFIEAIEPGADDGRIAFGLLVDLLETLADQQPEGDLFPLLFRARLIFTMGFTPDFLSCSRCGAVLNGAGKVLFSVESGQVTCSACKSDNKAVDGLARPVTVGALRALDWIMRSSPAQWSGVGMSADVRSQIFELIEFFVAYHLGLQWEGRNYKKV